MNYKDLISKLTLEEKASLLSGRDNFTTKGIERLGIPSMYLSDGPHGLRKQAGSSDHLGLNGSIPATCFPTAATVANSWDLALGEELGKYLGEEAVAQGVSMLLGPGLNMKRSPLCGRNFEYFSEDPVLAGKLAAAYIRGIQQKGISACPKHFAANNQEQLRMSGDAIVDQRTLREIYLTGFEIAVQEGKPHAIMSSYNKINGVYANENPALLTEVLREDWGFEGVVVSDWGGSNDRTDGLIAGNHLEMPGTEGSSDRELVAAVKAGKLSQDLLDRRVDEYLTVLFAIQIPKDAPAEFDETAHHAMAQRVAEQSIVLLKNENNLLPLKAGTKVAVLGDFAQTPRYQGAGSSIVNATRLDSTLDCIEESGLLSLGYAPGFLRGGGSDPAKQAQAVALAKDAEVVLLYLGLDEISESEGLDRPHMHMAQNQQDLLAAVLAVNPKVVVVLSGGAPMELPWADACPAIVHGYLGGQAGAGAMLRVLTGKVNPSGKLAETYPMTYEDSPAYRHFHGTERTVEYREGLFIGYRYYDKADLPVRFPFGFGLSYTSFAYGDLQVSEQALSFTLENIGAVAGAEIAQVYIGKPQSGIFRAKRELKGFAKVFLEPGERKTITVALDDKAFRYFNVDTGRFEIEPGAYEISVGASSRDLRLVSMLSVAGTAAALPYGGLQLPSYESGKVADVGDAEFTALLGHPIPEAKWDRSAPLGRNDTVAQLCYAKSGLARFAYGRIAAMKRKSEAKGKPDLNILSIYNMPFRGIAKLMGTMVDLSMVDGLLTVVNGHFFRGMGQLLSARSRMMNARKGEKHE